MDNNNNLYDRVQDKVQDKVQDVKNDIKEKANKIVDKVTGSNNDQKPYGNQDNWKQETPHDKQDDWKQDKSYDKNGYEKKQTETTHPYGNGRNSHDFDKTNGK